MQPHWLIHAGTGIRTGTVIRIRFYLIFKLMNFFCYCLLFWAKFQELHNYNNGRGLRDHLTPAPHFKYEKLKVREIITLRIGISQQKLSISMQKNLQLFKVGNVDSPTPDSFSERKAGINHCFLDNSIKMTTSVLG